MSTEHKPVAFNPDFADILVRCPIPGKEDLPAQRFEDFMATEVGQRVGGKALENVVTLQKNGFEADMAFDIALGGAVVKDPESQEIVRARREEEPLTQSLPEPAKKKLLNST